MNKNYLTRLQATTSALLLITLMVGCASPQIVVKDLPPLPKPQAPDQIMKPVQYDFLNQLKLIFTPTQEKPTK